MGGVEQVRTAVIQHRSPTGRGRWNSETEKAHSRLSENRARHPDRGLHDHGLDNVRQNVADDDAQITGAEGARGFDEFFFTRGEDLPADETRVTDPSTE